MNLCNGPKAFDCMSGRSFSYWIVTTFDDRLWTLSHGIVRDVIDDV